MWPPSGAGSWTLVTDLDVSSPRARGSDKSAPGDSTTEVWNIFSLKVGIIIGIEKEKLSQARSCQATIPQYQTKFLAPTGAQGVKMSVCASVRVTLCIQAFLKG